MLLGNRRSIIDFMISVRYTIIGSAFPTLCIILPKEYYNQYFIMEMWKISVRLGNMFTVNRKYLTHSCFWLLTLDVFWNIISLPHNQFHLLFQFKKHFLYVVAFSEILDENKFLLFHCKCLNSWMKCYKSLVSVMKHFCG